MPEINVPPLEPMLIDQLGMDNDAGAVRIKARFSEILAKGSSNYTIKEVRSDIKVSSFVSLIPFPYILEEMAFKIVVIIFSETSF